MKTKSKSLMNETTLRRQKRVLDAYDRIVSETPDNIRGSLSKSWFINEVANSLNNEYSSNYISQIIYNRNEITENYKKTFGVNE